MRDTGGHDRYRSGLIGDGCTIVDAHTGARDDFMCLKLRLVDVIFDAFVRRDAHQMIAELSCSVFRRDDVLELYAFKDGML